MRPVLTVAVVAAAGGGLAGVASGPASAYAAAPVAGSARPGSPRFHVPGHPKAKLWITVRQFSTGPAWRWTLTCGPAGGTLPHAAQACHLLGRARRPFAPPSPRAMCPMISYGPQTVTITGYWYGTPVSVRFGRYDGCQEAGWNKVVSAMGLSSLPGQVNPGGPMRPSPDGRSR